MAWLACYRAARPKPLPSQPRKSWTAPPAPHPPPLSPTAPHPSNPNLPRSPPNPLPTIPPQHPSLHRNSPTLPALPSLPRPPHRRIQAHLRHRRRRAQQRHRRHPMEEAFMPWIRAPCRRARHRKTMRLRARRCRWSPPLKPPHRVCLSRLCLLRCQLRWSARHSRCRWTLSGLLCRIPLPTRQRRYSSHRNPHCQCRWPSQRWRTRLRLLQLRSLLPLHPPPPLLFPLLPPIQRREAGRIGRNQNPPTCHHPPRRPPPSPPSPVQALVSHRWCWEVAEQGMMTRKMMRESATRQR
mmetsp:Transcript_16546/g.29505  ORF Transcript_16546/g.29505 Transcript_16546/m.29505 type:complete len:296 (+) Transcript_16546:1006-1893(+)